MFCKVFLRSSNSVIVTVEVSEPELWRDTQIPRAEQNARVEIANPGACMVDSRKNPRKRSGLAVSKVSVGERSRAEIALK